jgi:phosphoglycolate phosphatase
MRLAIFDVDGTLVDSRQVIAEAMDRAFVTLGLPPPGYERTRMIVGLSLAPAIVALAPDLPETEHPRLTDAYRDAFLEMRAEGWQEPLYEGAVDLLDMLRREGWKIGMATGKARRGVRHILDHHSLEPYFDVTVCADDGPGKPDPFMVNANLAATGIAAEGALMIGDTSFDMAMGRAAGVRTVGVGWGFHTEAEIRAGGADAFHLTFEALAADLARPAEAARGR